jgi:hypothetical protein
MRLWWADALFRWSVLLVLDSFVQHKELAFRNQAGNKVGPCPLLGVKMLTRTDPDGEDFLGPMAFAFAFKPLGRALTAAAPNSLTPKTDSRKRIAI